MWWNYWVCILVSTMKMVGLRSLNVTRIIYEVVKFCLMVGSGILCWAGSIFFFSNLNEWLAFMYYTYSLNLLSSFTWLYIFFEWWTTLNIVYFKKGYIMTKLSYYFLYIALSLHFNCSCGWSTFGVLGCYGWMFCLNRRKFRYLIILI